MRSEYANAKIELRFMGREGFRMMTVYRRKSWTGTDISSSLARRLTTSCVTLCSTYLSQDLVYLDIGHVPGEL